MKNLFLGEKPNIQNLPGGFEYNDSISLSHGDSMIKYIHKLKNDYVYVFNDILSHASCDKLIDLYYQSNNHQDVSVQGRKDISTDQIGSNRTTLWAVNLAQDLTNLFEKINVFKTIFNKDGKFTFNKFSSTDIDLSGETVDYKPFGVSPLLRLMKYQKGGQHYAHYDSGYIYNNSPYRTLFSIVLYLTTNTKGGATRVVYDGQEGTPTHLRNHDDWLTPVIDESVLYSVPPVKGRVMIFPHRLCHDVEQYFGDEPRIIIRGDIVCEKV
jgi:hypothetical protein